MIRMRVEIIEYIRWGAKARRAPKRDRRQVFLDFFDFALLSVVAGFFDLSRFKDAGFFDLSLSIDARFLDFSAETLAFFAPRPLFFKPPVFSLDLSMVGKLGNVFRPANLAAFFPCLVSHIQFCAIYKTILATSEETGAKLQNEDFLYHRSKICTLISLK
uniref:Uncharacterized protein n=1 Tax=Romanomermis culicivorax TaxID=13658 RepID=A0A915IUW2_ROMCU